MNIGVTGLNSLNNTKYTRFFLYYGANYMININNTNTIIDSAGKPIAPTMLNSAGKEINTPRYVYDANARVGVGIEVFVFKQIAIDAMFGYGIQYNSINGLSIGFTAECGLYYRL